MNYVLNPDYTLSVDEGRVMLMSKGKYFPPNWGGVSGFEGFIHPVFAVILSFFKGGNFNDSISEASVYLNVDLIYIRQFAKDLLNNENFFIVKYGDISMVFPPKTIVETTDEMSIYLYDPQSFINNNRIDLRHKRHSLPRDISLFLTSNCYTDCLYCLADRTMNIPSEHQLSTQRICELIQEAKELGVNSFEITGGEVFLHPDWFKIVSQLIDCGFVPYISTKIPISYSIVKKLKCLGVKEIQISLDSAENEILNKLVQPKEGGRYLERMKRTFYLLNENGINVCVHTIITSFNDSTQNIGIIYDFIKGYDNISSWRIDEAFFSRYSKSTWSKLRTSLKKMRLIHDFVKTYRGDINIDIDDYSSQSISFADKKEFLKKGVRCPANYSSMGILPDGMVTSCSRFFWTPQFLIGDIKKDSIKDVWQSEKAIELWNKKRAIRESNKTTNNGSKCYQCGDFDFCIDASRVCWSEIVDIYGLEKWDYPDMQCPDSDFEKAYEKNIEL
ncbi:radical SAM/SPASM domain-containing protein [Alkaliflexus imshenetskii]|uniref:radical SAM/SPASM domain-containing protein n=1 Tax=Alkaliflexus imshenetskii TaxID=286730 RepID=UPI00138ABF66|nr:radical SAM protein [Alkaliflexus imshenetskii]